MWSVIILTIMYGNNVINCYKCLQVCSVTTESACVEEMEEHCSLVQDAICRNVTETR